MPGDSSGYWNQIESCVGDHGDHSEASFNRSYVLNASRNMIRHWYGNEPTEESFVRTGTEQHLSDR